MAQQSGGGLVGWVVGTIEDVGEVGVGLLIALESIFPPIPSEVVLPFAGFSASRGELQPILAWVAATAGALLGAYVLYGVGALLGYDRVRDLAGRRWFVLFSRDDLARGERFFDAHGEKVVLLARFVPLLRSVVSVPAGLVRMPLGRFSAMTALGSGIWNAVFIGAGYQLGERWDVVGQWMGPVGYAVTAVVVAAIAWLVVRQVRRRT